MQYRRFGNEIFVRMDSGEEILSQVKELAEKEKIKLAKVSALGAVSSFVVGAYKIAEKEYRVNKFSGDFEIVSLTGTITTMDGEYYCHLHMSAGDSEGNVFGGHLNRAEISATCEMVITVIEGSTGRKKDEKTGLNLLVF